MHSDELIFSFQNGLGNSAGRFFPGLAAPHNSLSWWLDPGGAVMVEMQVGDLLSISSTGDDPYTVLAVFDEQGESNQALLGLRVDSGITGESTKCARFCGWLDACGIGKSKPVDISKLPGSENACVLKAKSACTVWLVSNAANDQIVEGLTSGASEIRLQRKSDSGLLLPPPLGQIHDEFTVPRSTARAYELKKGDIVQIIDVEGQQCSDFMAFRTEGLNQGKELMIDSTVTRTLVGRAYPTPGLFDKFFDSEMNPLLNLVQDTVGRHDTFALACTSRGYEDRGFPGHVNCSDNISAALAPFGIQSRAAWPAINFFFNSWIHQADNIIQSEEAWSRAGDYVALRAMDDLLCVSTACPDDIDPINGWNPTDIHVRIYRDNSSVHRAIAYREKENAAVSISEESAFHPRTSLLTEQFGPARDLWVPLVYPSVGVLGEYWACRNSVTVQDMSPLRKYDITGPDAEKLLQLAMTRNMAKLAVWRGTYALICDQQGNVIDDGTLFRLHEKLFRWCCGSEESARMLAAIAEEQRLQVRIKSMRGALPSLAVQGPLSRALLKKIVFTQPHVPSLDQLKWFGVTMARLHSRDGMPFMLTRSGYTGELGYELFCDRKDATTLWDAVMQAGEEFDVVPMGAHALEVVRIEAGLAAAGAEFSADVDAFEAGLGFAVDMKKQAFQGKDALERNQASPRRVQRGLLLQSDDVPPHGTRVFSGERDVGVVTSATRSPLKEQPIAMARLAIEHAEPGTELEVGLMGGHMKRLRATVCSVPFYDPKRTRARA